MHRTQVLFTALVFALPLSAQQAVHITKSGAGEGGFITVARTDASDRAMIGVTTSSGSKRDTLGVLISSIASGGPAEKAGLFEGDRIQSINGVSLRVSRDDAGDDEMGGIMQRRLTRELGKVKAGDEVTLVVWHEGASKTFKVKTVAADVLHPAPASAVKREERPVIGISFSVTGSKRDTAGVFVNAVTEDGPAEKAGIVEGDRIAAINGVSLKMSKDDLEDGWMANSRLNRLSREVAKGKPGDVVDLTVVSVGKARSVKVTLAKASSLKGSGGGASTIFRSPDGPMGWFSFSAPTPPMPPVAPLAPHASLAPVIRYRTYDGDEAEVRVQMDQVRKELECALQRELPKVRAEMKRSMEEARIEIGKAQKELQAVTEKRRIIRTVRM